MTLLLADIASYQGALTVAELRAAGFGGINVKVSHGLGQRAVHLAASRYVREARAAGMALSSFHWLTGDASGQAQADYAYRQMAELGLNVPGCAHVVDVEAAPHNVGGEPTRAIYVDYVRRMKQLLGRPISTYSGPWWWKPRGWASETPWLWSAPVGGYLPSYPGDDAPAWDAGYGGWAALDVMQYRVARVAGVEVSQSAVRFPHVWTLMTGGVPMAINSLPASTTLLNEINSLAPNRDKKSEGTIGDRAHASSPSDHNPDETGNTGGVEDSDAIDEVHARDVDSSGPWPAGWSMQRIVNIILDRCRSGQERRLRYIIFNGYIWSKSAGWARQVYNGSNKHTEHAHFSFEYGSGAGTSNPENITTPYGVKAAFDAEQEDDMTEAQLIAGLNKYFTSANGRKALAQAVLAFDPNDSTPGGVSNPDPEGTAAGNITVSPATALRDAIVTKTVAYQVRDRVDTVNKALGALATEVGKIVAALETPEIPSN